MNQALKIAITVNQTEIQERCNETFHVEARASRATDRSSRVARSSGTVKSTTQHAGASRTQSQNRKGPPRNLGNSDDLKWYECRGVGHFARECPTRKGRLNSSTPTSVGGRKTSRGSTGNSPQKALRWPKGRENDSTAGKRERKGSGDSSFHISVPENDGHFIVRVQSIAGAPTIKAKISRIHRVFALDTG
jgi:hypothetical protein